MRSLNREQKQILFDYSLGLVDEGEVGQAEGLIANNKEAAAIHSKLKTILAPLDRLRPEPCPERLEKRTVWRLMQLAHTEPPIRTPAVIRSRPWRNLAEVGAIAAVVLLVAGVLIPSFGFARYHYHKCVCQSQLAGIGSSMGCYSSDYDGNLPAVTADVSLPWYNVGYQGEENLSNTRNPYLLLKLGYHLRPEDFVCCARKQGSFSPLKTSQVQSYNDFPSRKHITYSFRVCCHLPMKLSLLGEQPLLADCNPVFENTRADKFEVRLDEELSTTLSMNHNRRGQNVLFTDEHVGFLKTRHAGIPRDDIFTVQNVAEYRGNERPVCDKDSFLGP